MIRLALQVLWPAFLMAGVLEMLVFAVLDPADMHWFGSGSMHWPRQAVYTVTFMIFWGVMSVAGAITAMLLLTSPSVDHEPPG